MHAERVGEGVLAGDAKRVELDERQALSQNIRPMVLHVWTVLDEDRHDLTAFLYDNIWDPHGTSPPVSSQEQAPPTKARGIPVARNYLGKGSTNSLRYRRF
jgi:hypothetical protein